MLQITKYVATVLEQQNADALKEPSNEVTECSQVSPIASPELLIDVVSTSTTEVSL